MAEVNNKKYVSILVRNDDSSGVEQDYYVRDLEAQTSLKNKQGQPEKIEYLALRGKIENSVLEIGREYEITDYTVVLPESYLNNYSVNNEIKFNIVVKAVSINTLSEIARAVKNTSATSSTSINFEAWKLKYCIFNESSRFSWASTAKDEENKELGRGVIYWLKDEYDNEAPFDFKTIKVNDNNTFGENCFGNIIKTVYNSSNKQELPNKIIFRNNCKHNIVNEGASDLTVPENSTNKVYNLGQIGTDTTINAGVTVTKTLDVTGATTLSSTLGVTGATTLGSTLEVTKATTLKSTLNVGSDFKINTNKFTVTASTGNTTIAGTLDVTGATTLSKGFKTGALGGGVAVEGGANTCVVDGNFGFYTINKYNTNSSGNYANIPTESTDNYNSLIWVSGVSTSFGHQLYFSANTSGSGNTTSSDALFIRKLYKGNWRDWKRVLIDGTNLSTTFNGSVTINGSTNITGSSIIIGNHNSDVLDINTKNLFINSGVTNGKISLYTTESNQESDNKTKYNHDYLTLASGTDTSANEGNCGKIDLRSGRINIVIDSLPNVKILNPSIAFRIKGKESGYGNEHKAVFNIGNRDYTYTNNTITGGSAQIWTAGTNYLSRFQVNTILEATNIVKIVNNSPQLIFQRGELGSDTYVDWRLVNDAGHFRFQRNQDNTWTNILSLTPSADSTINSIYKLSLNNNNINNEMLYVYGLSTFKGNISLTEASTGVGKNIDCTGDINFVQKSSGKGYNFYTKHTDTTSYNLKMSIQGSYVDIKNDAILRFLGNTKSVDDSGNYSSSAGGGSILFKIDPDRNYSWGLIPWVDKGKKPSDLSLVFQYNNNGTLENRLFFTRNDLTIHQKVSIYNSVLVTIPNTVDSNNKKQERFCVYAGGGPVFNAGYLDDKARIWTSESLDYFHIKTKLIVGNSIEISNYTQTSTFRGSSLNLAVSNGDNSQITFFAKDKTKEEFLALMHIGYTGGDRRIWINSNVSGVDFYTTVNIFSSSLRVGSNSGGTFYGADYKSGQIYYNGTDSYYIISNNSGIVNICKYTSNISFYSRDSNGNNSRLFYTGINTSNQKYTIFECNSVSISGSLTVDSSTTHNNKVSLYTSSTSTSSTTPVLYFARPSQKNTWGIYGDISTNNYSLVFQYSNSSSVFSTILKLDGSSRRLELFGSNPSIRFNRYKYDGSNIGYSWEAIIGSGDFYLKRTSTADDTSLSTWTDVLKLKHTPTESDPSLITTPYLKLATTKTIISGSTSIGGTSYSNYLTGINNVLVSSGTNGESRAIIRTYKRDDSGNVTNSTVDLLQIGYTGGNLKIWTATYSSGLKGFDIYCPLNVIGQNLCINNGTTNKFTVDSSTGNTDIKGTLKVGYTDSESNYFIKNGTELGIYKMSVDLYNGSSFSLHDENNPSINRLYISSDGNLTLKDDSGTTRFRVYSGSGNTTIAGTLDVTGATTITGATTLKSSLYVKNGSTNKFTVDNSTGNTDIKGTLSVAGATTLKNLTLDATSHTIGVTNTESVDMYVRAGEMRIVNQETTFKNGSATTCATVFYTKVGSVTTRYLSIGYDFSNKYHNVKASCRVESSVGFYQSSDETLKTNFSPVVVNLDDISKLRKVYYNWKNNPEVRERQIGMIAQDVQKLYPELVGTDENGKLNLSYDKLGVIALEGLDVLYKEHCELKDRYEALEKRLEALEKLINGGK